MGPPLRRISVLLVVLLGLAATADAQLADPKAPFIEAFRQFSVALDGAYGDEGGRILSSLDAMDRALAAWDGAIQMYEAEIARERVGAPADKAAAMHVALGAIYLDRSRVDDALREFEAATQLDRTRADIQKFRALVYSQLLNDMPAATTAFREAATLDPGDPLAVYQWGRQLLKISEQDAARQVLRHFQELAPWGVAPPGRVAADAPFIRLALIPEANEVEPFFPPIRYQDGFALVRRGEYSRAIARFREEAAHDPLVARSGAAAQTLERASAAFRDGSVRDAVASLNAAIELAPDDPEPHRILGMVHVADQRHNEGIEELGKAIRLDRGEERARLALAEAFADTGQYKPAEQALRETIEVFPASGTAHYKLARLHRWQKQDLEALPEFEKAAGFAPMLGANSIYQSVGALYAAQARYDSAVEAYAKRIDLHPNDAVAHHDLGDIYSRIGRDDEAMAEFIVSGLLNPRYADAHAGVANLHLRAGRYSECAEEARRTLALDPSHKQARLALGTSLMRLGRTEEGRQELREYERLQAEAAAAQTRHLELDALKREASISSSKGNNAETVRLLRLALDFERDVASAHFALGLALLKAGQPAEAIERFKSAEALEDRADVHRRLAEAYAALGNVEGGQREQAIFDRMKQERIRAR